jgi:Fanconi anemia group M protein
VSKEYKLKVVPRIYQQNIFKNVLNKNSLIVLPTGLGKTLIAIMLIIYHLRRSPNKKILFLAPTKPLVEQHRKSILDLTNLSEEEVSLYTGDKKLEKRRAIFEKEEVKVIVATPQTILNDLSKGEVSLKDFSLVIFDEAHRAVGNYDYVLIAKEAFKRGLQIIGLTASPGSEKEKVKEILNNLFIEKIEVRTYKSIDVKPYIKKIKQNWVFVELPKEFKVIRDYFKDLAKDYYKKLKNILDFFYQNNHFLILPKFEKLSKKDLLNLQKELSALINEIKEKELKEKGFEAIVYLNVLIKLTYLIEVLETQGKHSALDYGYKIIEEGRGKKNKASQALLDDERFRKGVILLEKISIDHPKLEKLVEIINEELKEGRNKKFIVFTQYRNSAKIIKEWLEKNGIKAERFVGQASKEGDKGLKRKEQVELIEKFRNNEFQVLVATSVAEEGIDIPAVDSVIFYEPVPSEIRTIQRRGRTGRQKEGKVYFLITKNTVDMAYYYSARKKEKEMIEELEDLANLEFEVKFKREDKKKELEIIVDDRERNVKLLNKLEEVFNIKKERLDVGDFVISDRIVIERKTLEDFLASLLDKRIFEQIEKLKASYEKPLIIVEGSTDLEDLFNLRDIHPNAIRGLLLTIMIDYNIPIIFVKNEEEFVNLLEILARREQLKGNKKPLVKIVKKTKTIKEAQEILISSIPGINIQLASNLLLYFKNPKNIANASVNELKKVPLIGEEKAKKIFEVFNKDYEVLEENKLEIKEKKEEKIKSLKEFLK